MYNLGPHKYSQDDKGKKKFIDLLFIKSMND